MERVELKTISGYKEKYDGLRAHAAGGSEMLASGTMVKVELVEIEEGDYHGEAIKLEERLKVTNGLFWVDLYRQFLLGPDGLLRYGETVHSKFLKLLSDEVCSFNKKGVINRYSDEEQNRKIEFENLAFEIAERF